MPAARRLEIIPAAIGTLALGDLRQKALAREVPGRIPSATAVRARIQAAPPTFRADFRLDQEAGTIPEGSGAPDSGEARLETD